MKIPNKDIHGDAGTARANRNDLLVQAMANREKVDTNRQGDLDQEQQLLNTIQDSIEQATRKKQHLLYKQRHYMSETLDNQKEERRKADAEDKRHRMQRSEYFPFVYQEEIEKRRQAAKEVMKDDCRNKLQQERDRLETIKSEKARIYEQRQAQLEQMPLEQPSPIPSAGAN